jgi:putative transposase
MRRKSKRQTAETPLARLRFSTSWSTKGPLTREELEAAVHNQRNGTSGKTVLTDDGPLPIDVPRDREGRFEPQLIGKHKRRFTGFGRQIIALYARGMTIREFQAFLAQMYALDVSPDLISSVTDAVVAEVMAWQARSLEPMYPVVFFDALRVKIREARLSAGRRLLGAGDPA